MNNILEITENEYLIKLNRKQFNLSFIRSLLTMVEVSSPSDEETYSAERRNSTSQNYPAEPGYFGSLEEK